jgi:hypothetical protein
MTRRIAALLATAGLLGFGRASPAPAQSVQQAQTENWLGCPAGHALETAPDPRVLPAGANLQRPEPWLVVRCVARGTPQPPICPRGMRVSPELGADRCATARSSGPAVMGDGSVRSVSDGTSRTTMVGEAPPPGQTMTDGSSNTVMVGEKPPGSGLTTGKGTGTITTAPSSPACLVPRRLVVDPGGAAADACVEISIALPGDRVPLPAR